MKSEKYDLIKKAAKDLRSAGAVCVSIMTTWKDGKTESLIDMDLIPSKKRGLGKGLDKIAQENSGTVKI